MIVTDVGGLKETIGDRGTGIVSSEGTLDAIAEEIIKYFDNPNTKESCIQDIRLEKERLSWKKFADELIDFTNKL